MKNLKSISFDLYRFGRSHPLLSAAVLFCVGCFFSLTEVIEEALEGDTHDIDTKILLMMRDPIDSKTPWGPLWLQEMMRDFTGLGGIGILSLITIAICLYLFINQKRGMALYVFCATATGTILSNILKIGFDRPRPDLVPHDSITYMASLPSGHSLMAAVVYLTLGALLAQTQTRRVIKIYIMAVAVILTMLVGISRIYLGVHWPSDVLAGWLAGTAWASMFWCLSYAQRNWPLNFRG